MKRLPYQLAPEDPPAGGAPPATPPAPPAEDAAAAEAAALLARRKAEAEAVRRAEGDAPVKMVDLHDLRAELRGEVEQLRRAEPVRHAPAPAAPTPAQRRRGNALPVVLLVLVLAALGALAAAANRVKRARP